MDTTVYTKAYTPPPINTKEIMRYAGIQAPTPQTDILIDECLKEAGAISRYLVCYRKLPLSHNGNVLSIGNIKTESADLQKCLCGYTEAIVFAATVGIEFDRLIAKHSRLSPAKALIVQAMGTERVESLCNSFCHDMAKLYKTTPRFSPGYGDLPLKMQTDIFAMLDCGRKIGVSLNQSLLMTPSKSVTAIMGITNK